MMGRICCRPGLKDPSNTRSALHTSRESGPRAALPLRRDLADPRRPVAQTRARATAASKGRGHVLAQGATLRDILRGDPDRVAVGHGGAVVTPAGARGIAHECLVARAAVVRP